MPSLTCTLTYIPSIDTLSKKLRDYHKNATAELDVVPIICSPENKILRDIARMHRFYVKIRRIEVTKQPGIYEVHGETSVSTRQGIILCEVKACFDEKLRGKHGTLFLTWGEEKTCRG